MRNALLAFALFITAPALAEEFHQLTAEEQTKLEARVARIKEDVAEIRGLAFTEDIGVEHQSSEDFAKYLDNELEKQIPEEKNEVYGLVIQKLGLYRGPKLENFRDSVKRVMTSQAGAYYDPETKTFYVLMTRMSDIMMGTLYAHELYHGLQDQHFGLNDFFLDKLPDLNEDEILARQSVVEGEATLMMMMWMMKSMSGNVPDPSMLEIAISSQVQLDTDSMRGMLKSGLVDPEQLGDMAEATRAMDELPRFMLETLVGAYMKGMGFVFELYKGGGWDEVSKLYTERPPASSEQILHPEKWIEDERPTKIEWPDFKKIEALQDWELLEQNTLGEIQLRIIFEEFGMKNRAKAVAEGWDGDRYAVLRKKGTDETLLLLFTSWDTEGDVLQFEAAYQDLLKLKYTDEETRTRVMIQENKAWVVEAPASFDMDTLGSLESDIMLAR